MREYLERLSVEVLAFRSEAVFLEAARGFVGVGMFDETAIEQHLIFV